VFTVGQGDWPTDGRTARGSRRDHGQRRSAIRSINRAAASKVGIPSLVNSAGLGVEVEFLTRELHARRSTDWQMHPQS